MVQGSNVLSPAILRFLPLKGTSIIPRFDAGRAAALIRNLVESDKLSAVDPSGSEIAGKFNSHSNKLGLAPPQSILPLNCSRVLSFVFGMF